MLLLLCAKPHIPQRKGSLGVLALHAQHASSSSEQAACGVVPCVGQYVVDSVVVSSGKSTAIRPQESTLTSQPWAYVTLECYGCIDCTTYATHYCDHPHPPPPTPHPPPPPPTPLSLSHAPPSLASKEGCFLTCLPLSSICPTPASPSLSPSLSHPSLSHPSPLPLPPVVDRYPTQPTDFTAMSLVLANGEPVTPAWLVRAPSLQPLFVMPHCCLWCHHALPLHCLQAAVHLFHGLGYPVHVRFCSLSTLIRMSPSTFPYLHAQPHTKHQHKGHPMLW